MITVSPIPAYTDNYIWLIENSLGEAVVVDPGDANPVLATLSEKKLKLVAIIVTHHHWDHVDGIDDLRRFYDVPVYGPDSARIPHVTNTVSEGDTVTLFSSSSSSSSPLQLQSLQLEVLSVPGHTYDHIAYRSNIDNQPVIFCGDTLFAAGCGRLFDGTHEQFCHSLQRINQMPANTQIFCTHEYTMANLAFAAAVEPANTAIKKRTKTERTKREQGQSTLPTNLALERETNPFLRYEQPHIAQSINQYWKTESTSPEDLFTGLRRWKDNF
ncbi:MAG: hydroxyacylglutathione hydrolase [Cellvibrionaceae bacterium]